MKKDQFCIDDEPMTMNGEPIPEAMIHVIYAIGRRGKPSLSQIASQLSKVGLDGLQRRSIINQLSLAGVVEKHQISGIGKRGQKELKLSLTEIGGQIYKKYFDESPVQAGSS